MFFIYAKMEKPWKDYHGKWHDPDKRFSAIDGAGQQVSRLAQACEFTTREDAKNFIESHNWRDGIKLEIRKRN